MTYDDPLSWRSHGQMSNIHGSFSRAEDDNRRVGAKLLARLEARRVK